jgi:hypothetical protein
VCSKLKSAYSLKPKVLVEPTFGEGSLVESALSAFPGIRKVFGIEIDRGHFASASCRIRKLYSSADLQLFNADVFSFDFGNIAEILSAEDDILFLGNPPWITCSELSALGSRNVPPKINIRGWKGLDALTGKANFDISEAIVLRILASFSAFRTTLAMLVKASVARNIVRDMEMFGLPKQAAELHLFDAGLVFGVSCEAGLLVLKEGGSEAGTCNVYDFISGDHLHRFGWRRGSFFSDLDGGSLEINGICPFEWRQGVKHDCIKVMEFMAEGEGFMSNGLGERERLPVGTSIFPLLKGSDLRSYVAALPRKLVLIPQRGIGEDTSCLETDDPEVWRYLLRHRNRLAARRSAVYRGRPEFSVFGIGPYAFANFKVGISGFYKEPLFSLVMGDPPVMLDDTCYYLSFSGLKDASITLALLNSQLCADFLRSVAFLGSKRPFTKEVLARIGIFGLAAKLGIQYIRDFLRQAVPSVIVSDSDFEVYLGRISGNG